MLVLRPGALGDTLLAVPALRALRRSFGSVTLAANAAAARFLASVGEVDRGIAFDDPSLGWVFTGGHSEETVVAWVTNAQAFAVLRTAAVAAPSRPSEPDEHCARYLLRSLAPLGIEVAWDDHPLAVTPVVTDEVLIHPGSGSAAKNWPAARFAEVIARVDGPVRVIVGEADHAVVGDLQAAVGHALPRLKEPDLATLAARLAGCRAYLGNDSGVSHLAGLCGARALTLFGPTNPSTWRPLGPRVEVLPFEAEPARVAARLSES